MSKLTSYFENATTVTQFPVTAGTADLGAPSVVADPQRKVCEFYNNDATNAIYVSISPTYTTAQTNGRVIGAGLSWIHRSLRSQLRPPQVSIAQAQLQSLVLARPLQLARRAPTLPSPVPPSAKVIAIQS